MADSNFSRREFLKFNTLAGLGVALNQLMPNSVFGKNYDTSIGHEPAFYFDAVTTIGPHKYKHPAEQWKLDDLIKELEFCSVSGALVSNTLSVTYDAMFSNLELSRMLAPYKNLFAVWNVLPDQTDEFPSAEELGSLMEKYDVRAVSICPTTNAWDWKASYNQELLKWLSKKRVLTLIDYAEFGNWDEVEQLLGAFPHLPLLVHNIYWSDQRYLIPSMVHHKNLHCTFDHLQNMYGIEYMYKKGLVDQMLFGSNAPTMSAGAHRTFMDYADIPESAREKIAGGNLIRLLKGQKPPAVIENKSEDVFMAAVRRGQIVPATVLDMHMHILHEGLNGAGWGYTMEGGGPRGVFELVKKLGYSGGGFMSWNGVVSSDSSGGNITTKECLDVAPRGYWGLANFDPVHYSQSELKNMIPSLYENDGRFIGMKPYHYIGVRYDDPSWNVWWEYGNEHKLYALLHSQQTDMNEYTTLASRYPNCRWIIAHAGQSFTYAEKCVHVAKEHPNVYLDITLTSVPLGMIEYLVENGGVGKVLYGSDLPMRDPRPQFGWVIFSHLSLEEKRRVLGLNAYEVIQPCLSRLPESSRPVLK